MRIIKHVSNAIPDGNLRKVMKTLYYPFKIYERWRQNPFNNISTKKIEKAIYDGKDKLVFIRLNTGLKFFCYPTPNNFKYFYNTSQKKKKFIFETAYAILIYNETKDYDKYFSINKGDVVIDIGAHVGFFSVYASKKVGKTGMVISIEPSEQNLRFLKKNIEVNNLKNITVIESSVWNKTGIRTLYSMGEGWENPTLVPNKNYKDFDMIDVKVIKLDDLISNLSKVDFIKMDIEGAELEALKGADEMLKEFHPYLAIASYHQRNGNPTYKVLPALLAKYGYKCKTRKFKEITTYCK